MVGSLLGGVVGGEVILVRIQAPVGESLIVIVYCCTIIIVA